MKQLNKLGQGFNQIALKSSIFQAMNSELQK